MLRGYQRAAWDLEQGLGTPVTQRRGLPGHARALLDAPGQEDPGLASAERNAGGITAPQALLGFFLIMVVLGVVPAYIVVWFCSVLLVLACVRVRIQAGQAIEDLHLVHGRDLSPAPRIFPAAPRGGPPGTGPVVRLLPGGGMIILNADPSANLERINMQLADLDREFDGSDYDALLRLDQTSGARGPPLQETDLATLPVHGYKLPRAAALAAAGSSSSSTTPASATTSQAAPAPGALFGEAHSGSRSPSAAAAAGAGAAAEAGSASAGADGLTCSVCLDAVAEGATVLTLPCLHQFHRDCIVPWLRQQGKRATCPMCKTPVFN